MTFFLVICIHVRRASDFVFVIFFSFFAGNNALDWCSVSSASLTVGGTPPRARYCRGRVTTDIPLNPLEILTGEGQSESVAAAAGGWLSGTASGERNLVASGMDTVGALDPEEVRAP